MITRTLKCRITAIATLLLVATAGTFAAKSAQTTPRRQMENLGRGVVAINQGNGKVFVSWRMLGTDPGNIAFNLYRSTDGGAPVKLNGRPLTGPTGFVDEKADRTKSNAYFVRPVTAGLLGMRREQAASAAFTLPANAPVRQYLAIPLHKEPSDKRISWGHVAPGDLDGDGEYDFVINRSDGRNQDPGGTHSNSTDTIKIEGYKRDGTYLWRIDLGWNIELGNDYAPMLVYDVNGDGIAEIITKTAEVTTDGTGAKIGDTDGDGKVDYRETSGRVLSGPEFLSVFSGQTGRELGRTNWPTRGNVSDWGDTYGNRVSRHLMGIAYLDGVHPSIVVCQGIYRQTKVEAWNFSSGKLTNVWSWSSGGGNPAYEGQINQNVRGAYEGQVNQNIRMGDADSDGKDEALLGALVLDHDGTVLYCTGLGHGDYSSFSDIDPDRPGLEVFAIHESRHPTQGIELHDAATGTIVWGKGTTGDTDMGVAADIDPRTRGYECWTGGNVISNGLFDCRGNLIATNKPGSAFAVWWDGDLLRELMRGGSNGINIDKWDYTKGVSSNLFVSGPGGGIYGSGDVVGDWREEVFSIWNNEEIRIYTTTIPTANRFRTLMHDPIYRLSQVVQPMRNMSPPQPGFYLGDGMKAPPRPNITMVQPKRRP